MGIERLKRLDSIRAERRELVAKYAQLLQDLPSLKFFTPKPTIPPNWQSCPIRLPDGAPLNHTETMQWLLYQAIATSRGIMNAHQEPPYNARN